MSSSDLSSSSESSFQHISSEIDEYESTISNAERLIESIDSMDLEMHFLSPCTPRSIRRPSQLANRTQLTPSSHEIEIDLERISRFCESIDDNLRSPTNGRVNSNEARINDMISSAVTSTPPEPVIIDLSETPIEAHRNLFSNYTLDADGDEDDVILVSSNLSDVVDLRSPIETQRSADHGNCNAFRRHGPLNDLSRPNRRIFQRTRVSNNLSRRRSVQTSTTNISPLNVNCISNANVAASGDCVVTDVTASASIASSNNSNSQSQGGLMCPVCMDSVLNHAPTSTKCGHVFCAHCIREAIRLTHKCPLCNTRLNPRTLFRLYL